MSCRRWPLLVQQQQAPRGARSPRRAAREGLGVGKRGAGACALVRACARRWNLSSVRVSRTWVPGGGPSSELDAIKLGWSSIARVSGNELPSPASEATGGTRRPSVCAASAASRWAASCKSWASRLRVSSRCASSAAGASFIAPVGSAPWPRKNKVEERDERRNSAATKQPRPGTPPPLSPHPQRKVPPLARSRRGAAPGRVPALSVAPSVSAGTRRGVARAAAPLG